MKIRPEQIGDEAAIRALTERAFEPMPFSSGTEASIVDQLRNDGDLALSLVWVEGDEIVGHIAFSPVSIDQEHTGWYGLGPVSVRPDLQRKNIGSGLIIEGLAQMKDMGAAGCVLVGDPGYYCRFDFQSDGNLVYGEVDPQYVQWLSFCAEAARGVLRYSPAFETQR